MVHARAGARATDAETEAAPSGKPIDSMVRDVQTVLEAPVPEPVQAPVAAAVAVDDAPGFFGEMKAGWRFLRGDPVLLANTVQAAIAQLTVGALIALTPVFAKEIFGDRPAWLGGCLRLHRDRPGCRQPDRRLRHRPHRHALRQGPHDHRGLRVLRPAHRPARTERQLRARHRLRVRGRHHQHDLGSSRARPYSRNGRRRS